MPSSTCASAMPGASLIALPSSLAACIQVVVHPVEPGQLDVRLGEVGGLAQLLDRLLHVVLVGRLHRAVDPPEVVVALLSVRLGGDALLEAAPGVGHLLVDAGEALLVEGGLVGHLGVVDGERDVVPLQLDEGALGQAGVVAHRQVAGGQVAGGGGGQLTLGRGVAALEAGERALEEDPVGLAVARVDLEGGGAGRLHPLVVAGQAARAGQRTPDRAVVLRPGRQLLEHADRRLRLLALDLDVGQREAGVDVRLVERQHLPVLGAGGVEIALAQEVVLGGEEVAVDLLVLLAALLRLDQDAAVALEALRLGGAAGECRHQERCDRDASLHCFPPASGAQFPIGTKLAQ